MIKFRIKYVILLLLIPYQTFAKVPQFASDHGHHFGLYAEGGYSLMNPWNVDVNLRHGYAVGGGILYEYEHNAFLMSIGCGFTWQQAGWQLGDSLQFIDQKQVDTQGKEYNLHTYLKRYDVVKRGFIDVPILLGGQSGAFYVLGGVKIGVGLISQSKMHANVTTIGDYDRYFVPFHNTPNHGFRTDVPTENSKVLTSMFDVRLSLELGAWLGGIETTGDVGVKARLALFADYGVFTDKMQKNNQFVSNRLHNFDFATYNLEPILRENGKHFLGNLVTGIKLTVLIGGENNSITSCKTCKILHNDYRPVKHKKKCIICGDKLYNAAGGAVR